MRMKLVVAGALLTALLLAGSAWADVSFVKAEIDRYGLMPTESGANTITVTNKGTDPLLKDASDVLKLENISGLTIDWKADLTITGGRRPSKGVGMINFTNGTFKLTEGTIKLPTEANNNWVDAIYASGNATVEVDGGTVKGNRRIDTGINVSEGTLIIKSGEIDVPNGNMVFAKDMEVSGPSVLNGIAFIDGMTAMVYGHASTVPDSEVFFEKYDPDDGSLPSSISYVAKNGAEWTIEGVTSDMTDLPRDIDVTMKTEGNGVINFKNTDLMFKGTFDVSEDGVLNVGVDSGDTSHLTNLVDGTATNDGTINIYGTLTNLDRVINNGIINNYSSNTLDNKGTLINKGTLKNYQEGKITNTGTINNDEGTIVNEGKIDNSKGTIESDAANFEGNLPDGNSIEQISDDTNSGDGGCNAGLGMVGLLLAGIVVLKRRAYVK
jgi:hypothetical protein